MVQRTGQDQSPHHFFIKAENRELLSADVEYNVLPLMYDSSMAVQEIYTLLLQDTTISNEIKNKLATGYPCKTDREKADFIAALLLFGMEREFRKRDANTKNLLAAGSLSPALKDFVFGVKAPAPCRFFCGRDMELDALHEMLCSQGKVFLQGIAGIGKSELAKAYAKRYSREYTNIIYFTYSGDLKRDIANLDFADDVDDNETMDARFSRHHRLLRRLRDDSLLIIDNFNTVTTRDSLLDVVLNYHCRIIFTTRSKFDNYASVNLEEIADTETLISLMGCFYSDAEKQRPVLEQYGLTHFHDSIVQITNYAVLLTDMGQPNVGLSALKKLCRVIQEYNSDKTMDYASVQEAMGGICLTIGDIQQATTHFKKAMAIYEVLFEAEPDVIEAKKQELLETYTQSGVYLGKKLLSK